MIIISEALRNNLTSLPVFIDSLANYLLIWYCIKQHMIMKVKLIPVALVALTLGSCVSSKKFKTVSSELYNAKNELATTTRTMNDYATEISKYEAQVKALSSQNDFLRSNNQELINIDPTKFKWVPAQGTWIKEPKVYDKTKMISMIASNKNMCDGHRKRLEWVERFRDQVDFFGRGFSTEIAKKEEGLCDYMFSIAIENASYETYFTEKLLDCFATGTIPVYYGAPNIGDVFNKDGIIDLSEEFDVSEEIYYSKMDAIKENLEITKSMEILEDFIWETYFK